MTAFDAIFVGAGQAGPFLAARMASKGLKVALIERKYLGGTCVNAGCMPTKTLVASARTAQVARRAAEYGVRIGGDVDVAMKTVRASGRQRHAGCPRRPTELVRSTRNDVRHLRTGSLRRAQHDLGLATRR